MKEQESILNDQVNGTLQDKTEKLLDIQQVEGTPFVTVTTENGTFVALGRGRITDNYGTKQEALDQIYPSNWDFMLSVIFAMIKTVEKGDYEEYTDTEEA